MSRLWMLLCLIGCSAPTQPKIINHENYYIQFLKNIDTIFINGSGTQVTETQRTKHISAITNIRDGRMVLITGNVYVQVTAGFGYTDTVVTVNPISYTNNGYVGIVVGAFPNMIGMRTQIIAKVIDDIRTVEEYKNPYLRKVLAADTLQLIILAR